MFVFWVFLQPFLFCMPASRFTSKLICNGESSCFYVRKSQRETFLSTALWNVCSYSNNLPSEWQCDQAIHLQVLLEGLVVHVDPACEKKQKTACTCNTNTCITTSLSNVCVDKHHFLASESSRMNIIHQYCEECLWFTKCKTCSERPVQ